VLHRVRADREIASRYGSLFQNVNKDTPFIQDLCCALIRQHPRFWIVLQNLFQGIDVIVIVVLVGEQNSREALEIADFHFPLNKRKWTRIDQESFLLTLHQNAGMDILRDFHFPLKAVIVPRSAAQSAQDGAGRNPALLKDSPC
jgi:hypothetical protein